MAAAALAQVSMSEREKHYPSQLSGGQQQRVAIARALVGSPKILLADEPTGNLDSRSARLVMDLLATLNGQGSTIVMVTHDMRSAQQARRQISLCDGKLMNDLRQLSAGVAVDLGLAPMAVGGRRRLPALDWLS